MGALPNGYNAAANAILLLLRLLIPPPPPIDAVASGDIARLFFRSIKGIAKRGGGGGGGRRPLQRVTKYRTSHRIRAGGRKKKEVLSGQSFRVMFWCLFDGQTFTIFQTPPQLLGVPPTSLGGGGRGGEGRSATATVCLM